MKGEGSATKTHFQPPHRKCCLVANRVRRKKRPSRAKNGKA